MLIENNSDGFKVVNYRKQLTYKKRPSDAIRRHMPIMTKLDYSLSNSSEDDEQC